MTQVTYIDPKTGQIVYPPEEELEEWGHQYGYYPKTKAKTSVKKRIRPIQDDGWEEVDDEDFRPIVKDEIMTFVSRLLINSRGVEITGNFYIDPGSQTITYVSKGDGDGTGGHVVLSADKAVSRRMRDKHLGQTPNGQWHSHPSLGAFWSITDLTDQAKDLRMASVFHKKGERYFLVVSDLEWLIRRYRWDDEQDIKVYTDTHVYMENGGQLLGTKRYTYRYSTRYQRNSYRPAAAVADDAVLGKVKDLDGLAKLMRSDPNLYKKLSAQERGWVFNLIWKEYGNTSELISALGVSTTAEAVNTIFAYFRLKSAKWILNNPESWERVARRIEEARLARSHDKGSEMPQEVDQQSASRGGYGDG